MDVMFRSDSGGTVAPSPRAPLAQSGSGQPNPGITPGPGTRGRARSATSADAARQMLRQASDQLLAEARAACRREAVPASKQELSARIAARIGLSQAEVAACLRLRRRPARHQADDPMIALAATILGRREHAVFVARRASLPNDAQTLHHLATQLGVSIERIYQLEASALHKLATALR